MQQLYVVKNIFGVTPIEPRSIDQFVEIVKLLVRVPGDQFDRQPGLIRNECASARGGGEMAKKEVAALDGKCRLWRAGRG